MRKRQIALTPQTDVLSGQVWMDIDRNASVEVTSEENGYPIESALIGDENRGWRAASSRTQIVRVVFDEPQTLRRVQLVFEDSENIHGRRARNIRFEKSYANCAILALVVPCGRLRITPSNSPE